MTPSQKLPYSTHDHASHNLPPPLEHRPFSDPNHLAPEDAFFAHSPPRRHREHYANGSIEGNAVNGDSAGARVSLGGRRRHDKDRGRSRSRKGKGRWSKLLWVKHDCTIFPLQDGPDGNANSVPQIQTTTPTLLPSSPPSNATPASSPTTSGPSSPTPR